MKKMSFESTISFVLVSIFVEIDVGMDERGQNADHD